MMIYKNCKFCKGTGCVACPGEAAKAQANQAEPEPLLTVDPDDPQDMELLVSVFHRKNIEFAFQEGVDPMEGAVTGRGGGIRTLHRDLLIARFMQATKNETPANECPFCGSTSPRLFLGIGQHAEAGAEYECSDCGQKTFEDSPLE